MNQDFESANSGGEHGGAGVKLLIVAVVLILIAHAGYNYVPVAYQGENIKQEMSTAVVQAIAMPSSYGKTTDIVKQKILSVGVQNEMPGDALIEVKEINKSITARVYYVKMVPILPFGIYKYEYVFDYTAAPNGFLTK